MTENEVNRQSYHLRVAAAFVRGQREMDLALPPSLVVPDLAELGESGWERLVHLARRADLRVHPFKRKSGPPRVTKVLGVLKGLCPSSLLDVGSGRGAFLFPLLGEDGDFPVTAVDLLPRRMERLASVRRGGLSRLAAIRGDATALPFDGKSFDVVCALEVLEHIPDTERAMAEVIRVARRFAVFSVPSKRDDNPEHIHFFSKDGLRAKLEEAGGRRVRIEHVLNHRIAVVRTETP